MSRRRIPVIAAVGAVAVVLLQAGAAFGSNDGSANLAVQSGSTQYIEWHKGDAIVRLRVHAGLQMSTDRCIDAFFDWGTTGGHYDSRDVRVCKPGGTEDTDPGGDGYWAEDFGSRTITGSKTVMGLLIDDDYNSANSTFPIKNSDIQQGSEPAHVPITHTDWFARVRTLYQDGSVDTSENYSKPYTCPKKPIMGICPP